MNLLVVVLFSALVFGNTSGDRVYKRALQKSHEKSQSQKWMEAFLGRNLMFNQVPSLVNLLNRIALDYLQGCHTVILYDTQVEESDGLILQTLLGNFPLEYSHGKITNKYRVASADILQSSDKCISYIIFIGDVMRCVDVIGQQNQRKVIIVARSSQWRIHEFLNSELSRNFVNLLVMVKSEKIVPVGEELPYILYTHELYVDGLGSSQPLVLTSWKNGHLTRPDMILFPRKMSKGFAGHRFIISVSHQPPFVVKKKSEDDDDETWDGIEIGMIKMLSKVFNFTTDFREAADAAILGSTDAVVKETQKGKSNIGMAGVYVTDDKLAKVDMSYYHSSDCAAFVSLTSTALPRYRAIMGPFHWTVWLALTSVYIFAIFPIAFSDKHTLSHLLKTPEEVENMFWYVFGTFTNCFTFSGKDSWNKSTKMATRLLVGFYWLFTIIITACYTGSIIAFVTLPVYPSTVDTVQQLYSSGYSIGTLDKGGWQYWYQNMTDPTAVKLLRKMEYLPNIEMGLKNTTKAFFWSYAFLGSRAQLDFIIRTNFTTTAKRSVLHISDECLAHYSTGIVFTQGSVYKSVIDMGIMWAVQSGLITKLTHDVEWNLMRSATGKLLQASGGSKIKALKVEDRALTLDDTQGMFLLLGIGFLFGGASLLSEWFGGCFNLCKRRKKTRPNSISSNPRYYDVPTPREKLDSVQYNTSIFGGNVKELGNEEHGGSFSNSVIHKGQRAAVDYIVHKNDDEACATTDIEEAIDRIFDLEGLFGEENTDAKDTKDDIEEIEETQQEKQ